MNNIVAILSKAKQYIEQFGWCQEKYGNPSTGFCLSGAIRAAVDITDERAEPPELKDVYAVFTEPLKRRGKNPFRYAEALPNRRCSPEELELYREPYADAGEVIEYNDYHTRSKIAVLQLLDEALEEARNIT